MYNETRTRVPDVRVRGPDATRTILTYDRRRSIKAGAHKSGKKTRGRRVDLSRASPALTHHDNEALLTCYIYLREYERTLNRIRRGEDLSRGVSRNTVGKGKFSGRVRRAHIHIHSDSKFQNISSRRESRCGFFLHE